VKNELKDVYEYIDKNFERYIGSLRNYLKYSGIAATGEGIREAAEATANSIRAIGGEAKLVPLKGGNPVVYGKVKSKNPKAKTLLFYMMYDVVGVTPEEWTTPPFAAEIVDAEKLNLPAELGKVIVARGTHDKKGPNLGFILALGAIKEVRGDIPVNVLIVLEGDEEIYSPNLKQFIDEYYEELKEADAVYSPGSFRQLPSGLLVMQRGYNGLVEMDLEIKGGTWGGTTDGTDVFSVYVSFLDQPLLRLIRALSTMFSPDGKVLVEGFYDNWIPPTPEEKREIERAKEEALKEIMISLASVKRFKGSLPVPSDDMYEDFITAPHLFPVGINSNSSYMPLSFLPMKATARLHCRFGPNLSSEEIMQKIRRHLHKHGFPEIEVRYTTTRVEWSRSPVSEDVTQALIRMAEIHGVEYIVLPGSPGAFSMYLFNRPPLSKPMICGALGHGGRAHHADEYITVEGVRDQMKGTVTFLYEYAKARKQKKRRL